MISAISSDSLADTSPLAELLEKYITDEMVTRIGNEFLRGRTLWIGTTNLDAGRPVIWEIGRIAASGHPDASNLIRQIMRASASISGAFPPVYIEVTGPDGLIYDEMHVDGGASSQMFFYPRQTNWREVLDVLDVKGVPTAYLIRNALIKPEYEPVDPKLIPISGKTIESLIRTQGIGDFYRIYTIAQRDGIQIRASYIQKDAIDVTREKAFDRNYMNALFDYGYQRMQSGEAWKETTEIFKE